ncbi:hypothetical protein LMG31841_00372 [Paraburkholderia saeva]|uniref:Uncharacterized protein n=1 Tax=Paraburkholderia saeva TaxID=2777537 RepID=A0A9N8RSU1_9BURK|nr:hypothetical protein R70241_00246 [Paraburkholderia saeva]CAG4887225.1 hypothetical protein LMG31841_00372 [Paraburkholderia saeva]
MVDWMYGSPVCSCRGGEVETWARYAPEAKRNLPPHMASGSI